MVSYLIRILLSLVLVFSAYTAFADDVTSSIQQALADYKAGNKKEALENLDYAAQLIRQARSEGIGTVLPQPLAGWRGEDTETHAVGAAMFGGGNGAERRYTKGNASITISIMADSPMVQSLSMMFTNPMFAGAGGGKLMKVQGRKAILNFRPSSSDGQLQMIIKDRVLVTVDGYGCTKEDVINYANAINISKLESKF